MSKRYLMWTLFSFLCACLLLSYIPQIPLLSCLIAGALIVGLFFAFRIPGRKLAVSCVVSFCVGFLFFTAYQQVTLRQQNRLVDQEVEICGTVEEVGKNSAGDLNRYRVKVTDIAGDSLRFYQTVKTYLYTEPDIVAVPGDSFQGTVKFFDTPVEYGLGREDGVVVSAYLSNGNSQFAKAVRRNASGLLSRYRSAVQSRLRFGTVKTQGLLHSVCFGDKSAMDSGLRVSLRRLGLSHVTAVSGLHLSFAVLLFNLLFSMIGVHYRLRHCFNILVAVAFTALVGFPPSCIRACVMLTVYSLGVALGLFSDALTSLSFSAFIIVLLSPSSIRDVGFLLSVSATAGILTLYGPMENFMFPKKIFKKFKLNQIYRKFTGIFACSAAASVATLPIILVCFGSVSLIGPLANVVLILPLQLLFMLGMCTVLFGWIPYVGSVLGFLCDLLYWFVDAVATPIGRMFFSSITAMPAVGFLFLILFLVICGVSVYHYIRYQKRSFIALALVFLCFCGSFGSVAALHKKDDEVRIAFVDVGQGDCTVISKGERAVIVDYGGDSQSRRHLIDYLEENSIYIVELLAFTHLHSDHTNGLRSLLQNVYVDRILYPRFTSDDPQVLPMIQNEANTPITQSCSYTVLGSVRLDVFADAALGNSGSKNNEQCVCYRVAFGSVSVMITGDSTMQGEANLISSDPNSTILKVSHHGSDTSSFYPFLKAVSPQIAVISVGENNYGLPNEQVIERLKTLCPIVLTTQNGSIIYRTDGNQLERISS